MPRNTTFGKFKDSGAISVTTRRRVGHSLTQKFKSMTKREGAWEAADKAALAGGTISASCTIACAAGATGAFAVAASGPFAAGALGVVGLFLAAKSTYSNRDKAHNTLQPYVWSYIDDEAPKLIIDPIRSDVGAAAMSLICDGQAQRKLADGKYRAKENAFNDFWNEYQKKSMALNALSGKTRQQMERMESILVAAYRNNESRQKLLEKAFTPSGAAHEFMRRLIHFGNYMQAATVVGKVMQKDTAALEDLAVTVPSVRDVRDKLEAISDRISRDDSTYEHVEKIMVGP